MKRFFCTLLLLFGLLFLYGKFIEPKMLKVNEEVISNEKINNSFNDFKIIQFSDLYYNDLTTEEYLEKISNMINIQKPDIVIFTGDLFSDYYIINDEDKEKLINFLNNINANINKYAINGDNDFKKIDEYKSILNDGGFIYLDNTIVPIYYKNNNPITITGYSNTNDYIENNNEGFKIGIIHKPDEINNIIDNNYDLVLAGHSLGNQINIPFYGGAIKSNGALLYSNGKYTINNTTLYVSNGLGTSKIKLRLNNIASVNVYRLHN